MKWAGTFDNKLDRPLSTPTGLNRGAMVNTRYLSAFLIPVVWLPHIPIIVCPSVRLKRVHPIDVTG